MCLHIQSYRLVRHKHRMQTVPKALQPKTYNTRHHILSQTQHTTWHDIPHIPINTQQITSHIKIITSHHRTRTLAYANVFGRDMFIAHVRSIPQGKWDGIFSVAYCLRAFCWRPLRESLYLCTLLDMATCLATDTFCKIRSLRIPLRDILPQWTRLAVVVSSQFSSFPLQAPILWWYCLCYSLWSGSSWTNLCSTNKHLWNIYKSRECGSDGAHNVVDNILRERVVGAAWLRSSFRCKTDVHMYKHTHAHVRCFDANWGCFLQHQTKWRPVVSFGDSPASRLVLPLGTSRPVVWSAADVRQ